MPWWCYKKPKVIKALPRVAIEPIEGIPTDWKINLEAVWKGDFLNLTLGDSIENCKEKVYYLCLYKGFQHILPTVMRGKIDGLVCEIKRTYADNILIGLKICFLPGDATKVSAEIIIPVFDKIYGCHETNGLGVVIWRLEDKLIKEYIMTPALGYSGSERILIEMDYLEYQRALEAKRLKKLEESKQAISQAFMGGAYNGNISG